MRTPASQRRFGMHRGESRQDTTLWDSAITQWLLISTLLFMGGALAIIFFAVPQTSDVKLQYNVYFGVSTHAPWWSPYVVVGTALCIVCIDYILAARLYKQKERIASYVLLIGGFLVMGAIIVMSLSLALNN